jgi:transcription elongation factor Elf1
MTRTSTGSSVGSVPANPSLRRHRKAVLTCPRCQHASSVDGDWIITHRQATVEVVCPVCNEVLTVRPPCHGPSCE